MYVLISAKYTHLAYMIYVLWYKYIIVEGMKMMIKDDDD